MVRRQQNLYRHPQMLRLAAGERAAVSARLRSCAGMHGLQLGAFADDGPPSLPLLPHWVRLHGGADRLDGDLRLDGTAALPFAEESFDLIWLKHALDRSRDPAPLLAASIRLLAPGGMLLISGLHPCSGWAPWCRFGREGGGRLHAPWLLQLALRLSGLSLSGRWRQGSSWPRAGADQRRRNRFGGAYMLLARKERAQILPFVTRLAASRRREAGRLSAVQAMQRQAEPDVAALSPAAGTCTLLSAMVRPDFLPEARTGPCSL